MSPNARRPPAAAAPYLSSSASRRRRPRAPAGRPCPRRGGTADLGDHLVAICIQAVLLLALSVAIAGVVPAAAPARTLPRDGWVGDEGALQAGHETNPRFVASAVAAPDDRPSDAQLPAILLSGGVGTAPGRKEPK